MTDRAREAVIAEARKGISAVTNCAWERLTPGERSGAEWALEALYDAGLLHAGWRPISEAPKDGTWLQLWRPIIDGPGIREPLIFARWLCLDDGEAWCWPDCIYEVFSEQGREDAEMEMRAGGFFCDDAFTHWRPLPPPPQKEPGNG